MGAIENRHPPAIKEFLDSWAIFVSRSPPVPVSLVAIPAHFAYRLQHSLTTNGNVVMGTITARPRKDGSTAYLAQITISRDGKAVVRENQTFDRRPAAAAWIKKRERELAEPGALEQRIEALCGWGHWPLSR